MQYFRQGIKAKKILTTGITEGCSRSVWPRVVDVNMERYHAGKLEFKGWVLRCLLKDYIEEKVLKWFLYEKEEGSKN